MRRSLASALLLLTPLAARAVPPDFAANGASTVTNSTGACTPATSTLGTVGADDIVLLVATGEGDDAGGALTLSDAQNFAAVTGSPISGDNNNAAEDTTEVDTGVWWVRGSSWTGTAPTVADSGDHTSCALHRFTGAATTGNPWDVIQTTIENSPNTSLSVSGASTTVADTLVVLVVGNSNNGTSSAVCSNWSNANLGSLTERFDSTHTGGLGGGHCIATGTWSSTGSFGATTGLVSSSSDASFAIALKPPTGTDVTQTITATGGNGAAGTVSTSLGVEQTATATGGNGAAGAVTTSTEVAVTVTGSSGVGASGVVVTETGSPVTVTATATGGNGAAGTVSATAGALATVVATSGLGAAGAVSASTGVGPTATGAGSLGAAGTVSASTGATRTVVGTGGNGAAGTVAAVISGDVTTSATGASGSGAAGIISALGTAVSTLTGAVGNGLAGVVSATITADTPVTVTLTGVAGVGLAGVLSVARIDLSRAPRAIGIMGRPAGELPTRPPSTTLQVR